MLSEAEVMERLRSGQVRVTYAFDPLTDPPQRLPSDSSVDPNENTARATQIFQQAFFGDRLGLTLGPLVLSHRYAWKRDRRRYKGRSGVFDLRLTDGRIRIQPGESITVNSNEQVALGSHTGAITLPRLSHGTAGLVLSASYIDPYWDGILVLQMVNLAARPFELAFGEKFAVTRFYDIQGPPLPIELRTRFAQKSHHYGLSWERILSSDADPFPLRKQPAPSLIRAADWTPLQLLSRFGRPFLAGGVSIVVVVSALLYLGQLQNQLNGLSELRRDQDAEARQLQQISSANTDLQIQRPRTGTVTISIPAGGDVAQVQVPIGNLSASSEHFAFAWPTPSNRNVTVDAQLLPGANAASSALVIKLTRLANSGTESVVVEWIVA
jgi:dUTPase